MSGCRRGDRNFGDLAKYSHISCAVWRGHQGSPRYEPFGRNGLTQLEPWLEARFTEELLAVADRDPERRGT
jgi:hypothetical protein